MTKIASNRRAFYDYEIIEKFEAGLSLLGREVKSLRAGRMNLAGGYVSFRPDGAWLDNVNIADWPQAAKTGVPYEPLRTRKLLLKKNELRRLVGKTTQKGLGVVPLECYFNKRGIAKIEIALVQGKREYDKKEAKKKKDLAREMRRDFAEKLKV